MGRAKNPQTVKKMPGSQKDIILIKFKQVELLKNTSF